MVARSTVNKGKGEIGQNRNQFGGGPARILIIFRDKDEKGEQEEKEEELASNKRAEKLKSIWNEK